MIDYDCTVPAEVPPHIQCLRSVGCLIREVDPKQLLARLAHNKCLDAKLESALVRLANERDEVLVLLDESLEEAEWAESIGRRAG